MLPRERLYRGGDLDEGAKASGTFDSRLTPFEAGRWARGGRLRLDGAFSAPVSSLDGTVVARRLALSLARARERYLASSTRAAAALVESSNDHSSINTVSAIFKKQIKNETE